MIKLEGNRKSNIDLGKIYFWTATINKWEWLLYENSYKDVIINSLDHLSQRNLIDVFGFVIMPNHIHLIWRLNALNGKEKPHSSFLKYTSHQFKSKLIKHEKMVRADTNHGRAEEPGSTNPRLSKLPQNLRLGPSQTENLALQIGKLNSTTYELESYLVNASNKTYEFWKRDSLAVELNNMEVAYQKLDYIHLNPTIKEWFLSDNPGDYRYSSYNFYETGNSEFRFLKHLGEEF